MREGVDLLLRNVIASSRIAPAGLRAPLLRRAGVDLGDGANLRDGLFFRGDVRVGSRCFLNAGSRFDAGEGRIVIGDNVVVGMQCLLVAAEHVLGGSQRRAIGGVATHIVVGDGCWLGARVMVLPGVTIAPGCVIGAGSLVTRDTVCNAVYAGSPARKLRALPDDAVDPGDPVALDRLVGLVDQGPRAGADRGALV